MMGASRRGLRSSQPLQRLAALHPLLKILLWAAFTIGCTFLLQLLFWLVGFDDELLGDRARGFALPLALLALTVLALADRRPLADFGLHLTERWPRQVFWGLSVGLLVGAASFGAAFAAGALTLREPLGFRHMGWVLLLLTPGAIALIVQQVIVSGYFLTLLRERMGVVVAVAISALLVVLLYRIDDPGGLIRQERWALIVGLALLQVLAATLRLATGNVLAGAMLLNGMLCIQRTVERKFAVVPDSPWLVWLAPAADPRGGVLIWVLLAAAIVLSAFAALRAARAPADPRSTGIPASLKRIYPFAMPMCLVQPGVLIACLARAGWRVGPAYVLRLVAVFILGTVNALLCLPERLAAPLIRRRRVAAPVFILGVHRSGTTHLHNLMALDPQLVAPTNHHVFNPQGALLFGWPMSALIAAFLPWRRPMDAVPMHMLTPNEEEFAIANLTACSPYWGWVFARQGRDYDRFLRPDGFREPERRRWERAVRLLVAKLGFWSGRRAVLKNPCNTGRVPMLLALYPDARIIHIHRHPFDVYRSNRHFEREMHPLWHLQDPPPADAYGDRFLANYAAMEQAFCRQTEGLAASQAAEVAFEELERDPIGAIRRVYRQLGLRFSPRFRLALRNYLRGVRGYQKNRLRALPSEESALVVAALGGLMERWGYSLPDGSDAPTAPRSGDPPRGPAGQPGDARRPDTGLPQPVPES